jgi:hypothetical protein
MHLNLLCFATCRDDRSHQTGNQTITSRFALQSNGPIGDRHAFAKKRERLAMLIEIKRLTPKDAAILDRIAADVFDEPFVMCVYEL